MLISYMPEISLTLRDLDFQQIKLESSPVRRAPDLSSS
jgi:hypothetical protein